METAMQNIKTQKPIKVGGDWTENPFIFMPVEQLQAVQQLLDANGIAYRTSDIYISIEGGPMKAQVRLASGTDTHRVQAILDSVP
jgi:hypothetical protein